MSRPPKVFVSYSHDSDPHKEWVLELAKDLRAAGIDAILDLWDLQAGQDVVRFMEQGISQSDRVILVCSDGYAERANARRGGVGYEGLIITGQLVANVDTKKFIPVVRNNTGSPNLPTYLGPRFYLDFSKNDEYVMRLEELVREIHQVPALEKPPLGVNPFATGRSPAGPSQRSRPRVFPGEPAAHIFADAWFQEHRQTAIEGLNNAGLSGAMEVSFALSRPLNKRPNDLLDAAYKAQVHTFGWPLGIVLGNREEFRPRATRDGILAEITLEDRSSYDYWALRKSGDYYLLASLFEDTRKPNSVFVDTRMIRTTEAFLLCDGLYRSLGLKDDAVVAIEIVQSGLKGRTLTMANSSRRVLPETTQEDLSETTIVMELADLRAKLVDNVVSVLEPMFMLFNYKEFDRKVYEDLVTNYAAGRVV